MDKLEEQSGASGEGPQGTKNDKNSDAGEAEIVNYVRKLGYHVKKTGTYTKAAFHVHEKTLAAFKKTAKEENYQVGEAITEAMDLWIEAKREKP